MDDNSEKSRTDHYEQILNRSSELIIELQMILSDMVYDILENSDEYKVDLAINFPYYRSDLQFENLMSEFIYLDMDMNQIFIKVEGEDRSISWDDLSISVQDLFANHIFIFAKTDEIYKSFSNN